MLVYQRVLVKSPFSPYISTDNPTPAAMSRPWSPVGSWWPNAARSQPGRCCGTSPWQRWGKWRVNQESLGIYIYILLGGFKHVLFPTLTCGVFVFSSVSAPRPPPPPSRPPSSLTHTRTHSHSLTLTHSHSLTLTHSHTHTHSLSLTHTLTHSHSHSLTLTHSHSLTHTLTHSHSLTHTHTLTHSHTHTHSLTPSLTHSLCLLRGRRGTMLAGVGQCALPRGRMYAPGFRWRPWVSAAFAWQAWDNVHCQGVGCTPRGSAGVPGSPPLLRGRRGTMCTAKGSDVRPGVPLASLGLRRFCVAGLGQCALPRGRMYAPEFRWRPWVSAAFAWQAWDNVHCQGVGCTPWGSAGVPGSPPLLRGRHGTMCTAKGSDVRPGVPLASLGLRRFCVAGVGQCALPRGRMYALGFRWRPWVSAAFAWQAWDNVHCQGVGCTPRGSAGVPGSPPLLRGDTHSHSLTHSLTYLTYLTYLPYLTTYLTYLTYRTHSLTHSLTSLHFTHFTHSHIPHSHTPHSHHSLTLSLTHCT